MDTEESSMSSTHNIIPEAAITIRNAYKKYFNHVVLKGLNMTVPENSM